MATKTYTWGDGSGDTFTIDYVGNSGQEVASVASQPNETNFHRQGAITLKSTDNEEVQVDVVQLCSAGGLAVLNTSAIPGASSTPYVRYFNGLYIWTDGVASRGTRVRYSTDGDTYTEWWCDESGTGINAYPYYENGTYYVFSAISSKPFVYKSTGVGEAFTLVDGVSTRISAHIIQNKLYAVSGKNLERWDTTTDTWVTVKTVSDCKNIASLYSDNVYIYIRYNSSSGAGYLITYAKVSDIADSDAWVIMPLPGDYYSSNYYYYYAGDNTRAYVYGTSSSTSIPVGAHICDEDWELTTQLFPNTTNLYISAKDGYYFISDDASRYLYAGKTLTSLAPLVVFAPSDRGITPNNCLDDYILGVSLTNTVNPAVHLIRTKGGMSSSKYPISVAVTKGGTPYPLDVTLKYATLVSPLDRNNNIYTGSVYSAKWDAYINGGEHVATLNVIESETPQSFSISIPVYAIYVNLIKAGQSYLGQSITATKGACVETGVQQTDGTYLFNITGGEWEFNINNGEEIKSINIEYSETQSVIDIYVGLIDLDFTTMTSLPTEFIQANEGWFLDGANGLRNKTEQAHSSGCAITFKDLGSGTVEVVFTQSSETSYDYTYVTNSSGTALGNTKGLTTTATTKTFTITDGIIKFNYKKDSSVSTGSDCTWIRSIKVIPT